MLSSKLGNSSELFLSSPEDFSIIKRNKKQKLSCENFGNGEKKSCWQKFLTQYLTSSLGNQSKPIRALAWFKARYKNF